MDINNILVKIENYKTATAERAEQERIATEHHRQRLLDQIRVMKPDIDNLVKVAEKAREAGIPLQVSFDRFDSSYERGDFFTDATTHKVGFVPTSFNNKAVIAVNMTSSRMVRQSTTKTAITGTTAKQALNISKSSSRNSPNSKRRSMITLKR